MSQRIFNQGNRIKDTKGNNKSITHFAFSSDEQESW